MERWIDVKGHPDYEVSNEGNVRRKRDGKMMRMSENKNHGYFRVSINGKHQYVHRLVAESFYDGDHSGEDVNHIDGNKYNNSLSNLEWTSRAENLKHASVNDLYRKRVVTVVPCKHCRFRENCDIRAGRSDDFYCADGRR